MVRRAPTISWSKACFRTGMQVTAQELLEDSGWEMLSLEETLASLERMSHPPSVEKFMCILNKCRKKKKLSYAKRLHAYMCKSGLEAHILLGNYLVPLLVEAGSMQDAQHIFDRLVDRNEHSWTSLITGYIECREPHHALILYQKMQEDHVHPSEFTFMALLKACARLKDVQKGLEIHAEIESKGLFDRDTFVGNALVDMYAKCGFHVKAREVFDKLPVRDVVSWTALIAGYVENGVAEEALDCFKQMGLEGISPNAVTFVCSLKACGSKGAIDKGQEIHADLARIGLESDLVVGSTLIDMYAKCGLPAKAREVFDKLPVRNVVSWTVLIAGYTKHGFGEEALNCFERMQLEGVSPDAFTFVCSLKACGSVGAIEKGQEIHTDIAKKGLLERDPFVGNALVDMYAKCGSHEKAREVFDKLPVRDVVSWTALITGYAHLGESENVFYMLERMRGEGIKPNRVTFLSVLTVCRHTGLVDKGQKYFEAMSKDYGIIPNIEHHNCMVDLLGRAGQLNEAVALMKQMPFLPDHVVWHTVLGACRKWGNVELGRQAFQCAVQVDSEDSAAYILMSNIYADAHTQKDDNNIEAMGASTSMEEAGIEFLD